ncbi:MAG: outer membrane beta-barrel domain-containing protein [Myxococcota bacterium]|jgi:outer membrane beta-barrel protein|nr:outer membrane beta-barrel domain-containing protein [Myxococcota bacterium]
MMVRSTLLYITLIGGLVIAPSSLSVAQAADEVGRIDAKTQRDRLRSVQRRKTRKAGRFSLVPSYGLTLNDPVVTTHTVGGSLYYHLAEGFSFVLGGDQRIMQVDSAAVHLVRSQERWVRGEQVMMSTFGFGASYTPVYGKMALFSDVVVHYDLFIEGRGGLTDIDAEFKPTGSAAVGGRLYLNEFMSLDLVGRWLMFTNEFRGVEDIKAPLFLHTGLAIYFPLKNRG